VVSELLYDFFRSSTGFCLAVIAMGFMVQPKRQPAYTALGFMYLSAGSAFLFSWISKYQTPPPALDLALLLIITYVLGVSVLDMVVYLFGDEARPGTRRKLLFAGLAWSIFLWLLPLLDTLFGLPTVRVSLEDAQLLAPLRTVSYFAVYLWPIAMLLTALRIAHFRLADLPGDSRSIKVLKINLGIAALLLLVIGAGLLFHSQLLYRGGQAALQLCFLLWYLFIRARPDVFIKARDDIETSHRRKVAITADEAGVMTRRLDALLHRPEALANPGFKLSDLAKASGIPAYRLSLYFNAHRGMSFSDWLNEARIRQACMLLCEKKNLSILDIAFEVGYSSKGTFNTQFQRRTGMTPSAYRKSR